MRGITDAVAIMAAVAMLLAGCAGVSSTAGSDPNNPDQVEAITWWTAGAEKTAFYDVIDVFKQQNPSLEFIDASVSGGGGDKARQAIGARLDTDNPPDTFQTAAGAGLTDYVSNGDLQDLTGFYAEHGLTDVYRAALLELLSVDGKIYSVPSEIHRVNVLWTNNALLRDADVDPAIAPANIDAWLVDLEKVRESGVDYPLALGEDWTQVQLFENVLLADLGAVLYQNLWKSTANWESDAMRKAIDHYGALLDYTDPASRDLEWAEATRTVVDGGAAYVIMADFAQSVGFTSGSLYSAVPTPGTVGVFDFLADSFALPVGAVHEAAAERWLLTVSSAEGQKALSLIKGSIPARTGTVSEDYPPYQQAAIASLQLDTVVPSLAHGVAANPAWTKAITTAIVKFAADGHPAALANALTAAAHDALGEK